MKIQGLAHLVTGACSGLGLGTARHLVARGGKVVLLDVNEKAGAQCVSELGDKNAHFLACDVTDESQVKYAFQEAQRVFGDVRTYVNCAGIAPGDFILKENDTHDSSIFKRVVDVNVFGSFLCTSYAALNLKSTPLLGKERGVIINVSSIGNRYCIKGFSAYGASKGALDGMLLPVARELGRYKIRVMNIAPGLMDTPMNARITEEDRKILASLTLKGELGEAQHFAKAVQAIIVNEYINGTVLKVDDGMIPPIL